MTPCAKGDEAETEEIFLPIQKKEREKHSSENKGDTTYCTKGEKKAKKENKTEEIRNKSLI